MNLSTPITITPRTFNPITLNELDITIIDNAKRKSVVVQVRPCPRPLVLWTKESYDLAGDYTQAQAEARILELLGENPSSVLEGLFLSPTRG